MEQDDPSGQLDELVDALGSSAPRAGFSSVAHLAYHGEPEEALDLLIATLIKKNVPVTPAQRSRIGDLMRFFAPESGSEPYYTYLSDSEMLDRMTVVDESS